MQRREGTQGQGARGSEECITLRSYSSRASVPGCCFHAGITLSTPVIVARNGEMNENLLEIHNLTKHYSGVKALDQVSFGVRKGEMHAICGENGAGKSTLIKT